MTRVELTERFADLVARDRFDLGEAALLIGAHADPGCDIEAGIGTLDDLAAAVPEPSVVALSRSLFGDNGFIGDQSSYYDPRNSYLHLVLSRRRGIPITLCIVLMEVARRVGVPIVGIGTPAHFVARHADDDDCYVDAFGGGQVLDRSQLDDRFAVIAPGIDIGPFLEPVPPTQIMLRVLGNLVAIHRRAGNRDALLWASQLRTLVPGSGADDRRAFGGALAACGDFARAAKVLESLVDDGHAADPETELAEAQRLRARLN